MELNITKDFILSEDEANKILKTANFNFAYTLDYVNSKVTFYRREKD